MTFKEFLSILFPLLFRRSINDNPYYRKIKEQMNALKKNKWISVKERTPDKSGITWVKINNSDTNVVQRYFSGFCGFWTHDLHKVTRVTHWKPFTEEE